MDVNFSQNNSQSFGMSLKLKNGATKNLRNLFDCTQTKEMQNFMNNDVNQMRKFKTPITIDGTDITVGNYKLLDHGGVAPKCRIHLPEGKVVDEKNWDTHVPLHPIYEHFGPDTIGLHVEDIKAGKRKIIKLNLPNNTTNPYLTPYRGMGLYMRFRLAESLAKVMDRHAALSAEKMYKNTGKI